MGMIYPNEQENKERTIFPIRFGKCVRTRKTPALKEKT